MAIGPASRFVALVLPMRPAHNILFLLRRDGCTAFTEGLQSLAPGSPSSPQSPLLGRGFWIWGGANTRVFFCASSVSRRGYPFILVTEVTEVTGEENATQRRHSTATIRSIDPELRYLQRGGQHPPVERNIDLTLITLFTRPVGLSLVHSALGAFGPFLVDTSAERRERSLLMPFALHRGFGTRSSYRSIPNNLRAEVA